MTDVELVRELAQPLSGMPTNYDPLLELIGDARIEGKPSGTYPFKV